jgi:hypothetical protein
VLLNEFVEVVENLALTFGERKHRFIPPDVRRHYTQKKGEGQGRAGSTWSVRVLPRLGCTGAGPGYFEDNK